MVIPRMEGHIPQMKMKGRKYITVDGGTYIAHAMPPLPQAYADDDTIPNEGGGVGVHLQASNFKGGRAGGCVGGRVLVPLCVRVLA